MVMILGAKPVDQGFCVGIADVYLYRKIYECHQRKKTNCSRFQGGEVSTNPVENVLQNLEGMLNRANDPSLGSTVPPNPSPLTS